MIAVPPKGRTPFLRALITPLVVPFKNGAVVSIGFDVREWSQ